MSICSTDEIALLSEKYKQIEEESLLIKSSRPEAFLCYRLDGIKASKTHLKDTLVNERYNRSFDKAINKLYFLFRDQTYRENNNFFYCAFSASDEVSLILNQGENYYQNRIFKIGSMLSGGLSSAMTIQFDLLKPKNKAKEKQKNKKKEEPQIMAFDSRPLVLNTTDDIKEYIKFRCAIACRNAACKVLRIESGYDIYEAGIKDDVAALFSKLEEYDLFESYSKVISAFSLYIPDLGRKLRRFKLGNHESFDMMMLRLDAFLSEPA
jgi:tRNA(His) 5'-end guanylyltransferase